MHSFFKSMHENFDAFKVTQKLEEYFPIEKRAAFAMKIQEAYAKYYCKHEGGIRYNNNEIWVYLQENSDTPRDIQVHKVVLNQNDSPKVGRRVGSDEFTNPYSEMVLAALIFIIDRERTPPSYFFENNAKYIAGVLD